jgi:hypothetical protein
MFWFRRKSKDVHVDRGSGSGTQAPVPTAGQCERPDAGSSPSPQGPAPDVVVNRFVRKSTLLELMRKTGKLDGHTFGGPPLQVFVEGLSETERLFAAYAYIVAGRALRVTLLRDNGEAAQVEMPIATYFGLEKSSWDRATEQPPPRWVRQLLDLMAKHQARTQGRRW